MANTTDEKDKKLGEQPASNTTDACVAADRKTHETEWSSVRETMKFFDDKLHDLRKLAFTFITALITIEGGLIVQKADTTISNRAKLAIYAVTLLLILAAYLMDKIYRVYQQAANMRGAVLENTLNLELSQTISERHRAAWLVFDVILVYIMFILAVLLLAWFSFSIKSYYLLYLAIGAVIGFTATTFILGNSFKYNFREDWTISPLECCKTGTVRVMLMNFRAPLTYKNALALYTRFSSVNQELPKPIDFSGKPTKKAWKAKYSNIKHPIVLRAGRDFFNVINEKTGEKSYTETPDRNLFIFDNYTWTLSRADFGEDGVYQIKPCAWPVPLSRRIIVSGKSCSQPADTK
jgi:hypothetical protein